MRANGPPTGCTVNTLLLCSVFWMPTEPYKPSDGIAPVNVEMYCEPFLRNVSTAAPNVVGLSVMINGNF